MCYFLYGGMNKEVDLEDFNKIEDHYFNFKIATPDQIKKSIARKDYKFSIGNDYCECDTPIGSGEENCLYKIQLFKRYY